MSTFTTKAVLELLPDFEYKIMEKFEYHIGSYPSEIVLTVPVGYITDLASTPRILWGFLPPNGRYAKAAIIHDYLYENAIGTKQWADDVFLEALKVLNVSRFQRFILYNAVRLFGKGKYVSNSPNWTHSSLQLFEPKSCQFY